MVRSVMKVRIVVKAMVVHVEFWYWLRKVVPWGKIKLIIL